MKIYKRECNSFCRGWILIEIVDKRDQLNCDLEMKIDEKVKDYKLFLVPNN